MHPDQFQSFVSNFVNINRIPILTAVLFPNRKSLLNRSKFEVRLPLFVIFLQQPPACRIGQPIRYKQSFSPLPILSLPKCGPTAIVHPVMCIQDNRPNRRIELRFVIDLCERQIIFPMQTLCRNIENRVRISLSIHSEIVHQQLILSVEVRIEKLKRSIISQR